MHKELIIATTSQESKLAILEDDELVEFTIERRRSQGIVGNIYKGRVTKVLPGMQSAFVDIGLERDAFLYVSDFLEDTDEYEKIVATAEAEVAAIQETPKLRPAMLPKPPAPAIPAPEVSAVIAPEPVVPVEVAALEEAKAAEAWESPAVVPITVKNIGNQGSVNMLSLDLKIDPNKSLSDYKCGVYVNDSLYLVKRCDSISSLAINVPINNIYFHFTKEPALTTTTAIAPPVFTDKYVTKTSRGNKLEIEVNFNDSYFYYKSFNGDTVKIKGRNIEIYDAYRKKWEKVLKVSETTNIFSHFNDQMQ